jgi:hypothetical protein
MTRVGFLLVLASCSSVRTFDMRWELTSGASCRGTGIDPTYASQQEITLRYDKAPNYFVLLCSDKLATLLKTDKKTTVPMVERRNGGPGSSTSICSIDGLKDDAPSTTCTFHGVVGAGHDNDPQPSPWD